jgi:hypothetical protein
MAPTNTHRIRNMFPDLRTEAMKAEDKRLESESLAQGQKEREQHAAYLQTKRTGSTDTARS